MSNISAAIPPIRWGILATGKIAALFAADLALVEDAELTAVGSRSIDSARRFADTHSSGARVYGSYAELATDPDVDVVYVATPHGRHVEDVMTCFEAGKAVLCEKALTLNADDTSTLIEEARHRGVFFAEAMWMRCNPNIRRSRTWSLPVRAAP
jgi:predicted dehydrogenase